MLNALSIRDFAVITRSELDFRPGMTVISGETGAGKSLLVDALGFLSGQRADTGVVRHGAARAELSATFSLVDAPAARAWLEANALDDGDECLLRRVLNADGGSKAWINGRAATSAQLVEIAGTLVEIHGQHAQQALLSKRAQLAQLDVLGRHETLLATTVDTAEQYRKARIALDILTQHGDVESRKLELGEALERLDAAVIEPAAQQALFARHRRMSHSAELMEACTRAQDALEGDAAGDGAIAALHAVKAQLLKAAQHEARLREVADLLDSAVIQTEEAANLLAVVRDDSEADPDSIAEAERELVRLQDLARKHRTRVEELHETRALLAEELEALANAGERQIQLENEMTAQHSAWRAAAAKLTQARLKTAKALAEDVTRLMATLGMGGGRFEVQVEPVEAETPDPQGTERIEFLVSANPGQPPRPLRKVASGGELSRIALAIQVAAMRGDMAPTLVFDEVDSGIGGAVADVVGGMLKTLAERCQVMCVTHLPQVAAHGTHHYRVAKSKDDSYTESALTVLDEHGRVTELARMLGGAKQSPEVMAAAVAMRAEAEAG